VRRERSEDVDDSQRSQSSGLCRQWLLRARGGRIGLSPVGCSYSVSPSDVACDAG
jgi:hypothetical protein